MKIGRFGITFFEKHGGEGIRVYLDTAKLQAWPEIDDWYFKRKTKEQQDGTLLLDQIREAGDSILSLQKVAVDPSISKRTKGAKVAVCPICNEGYPLDQGDRCRVCSGEIAYYKIEG